MPSSVKLEVMIEVVVKIAVEYVIDVGVQLLFWVGGGGWVDCGRIRLN